MPDAQWMTSLGQRLGKHMRGWFLASCPQRLIIDVGVREVSELYAWRNDGCLQRSDLTRPEQRAVEAFARGVVAAQNDRIKRGSDGKGKD
ncbi:MAG: hypothetical protein GY851_09235 [bacterium]|nr:hypothetical protein [bacterium]